MKTPSMLPMNEDDRALFQRAKLWVVGSGVSATVYAQDNQSDLTMYVKPSYAQSKFYWLNALGMTTSKPTYNGNFSRFTVKRLTVPYRDTAQEKSVNQIIGALKTVFIQTVNSAYEPIHSYNFHLFYQNAMCNDILKRYAWQLAILGEMLENSVIYNFGLDDNNFDNILFDNDNAILYDIFIFNE